MTKTEIFSTRDQAERAKHRDLSIALRQLRRELDRANRDVVELLALKARAETLDAEITAADQRIVGLSLRIDDLEARRQTALGRCNGGLSR